MKTNIILLFSSLFLQGYLASSFVIDSRVAPMKEETSPLTNRQNLAGSSCGPNCKKFSIEQYDETVTPQTSSSLRLSGGSSNDVENSRSSSKLVREMIAEFVGTFIIVQLGCGTVCSAVFKSAQVGLWQIAAVWSIAVTLAIR